MLQEPCCVSLLDAKAGRLDHMQSRSGMRLHRDKTLNTSSLQADAPLQLQHASHQVLQHDSCSVDAEISQASCEPSSILQAAVNMANVEIQYGSYPPLVTLAREIVTGQTQEIQEMRSILNVQYATSA